MSVQRVVDKYLHHLEFERRVTDASLKNYRSTLRRFSLWLGDRPLTEETVASFLSTFDNAASANVVGVRLRGLARYMKKPVDIVRAKEEVKPIEALDSKEIQALIKASSASRHDDLTPVITFLSETGLRFAEFCELKPSSLKTRGDVSWIEVFGKGRKHRKVPLSQAAFEAFARLPFNPTQWQQERIRLKLKQVGVRAKIGISVHPHLLRASFISILLNEKKKEAIKVAKIVGHSSVDTMMRHYYKESIDDLHRLVS